MAFILDLDNSDQGSGNQIPSAVLGSAVAGASSNFTPAPRALLLAQRVGAALQLPSLIRFQIFGQ